jgi:hypothetical protein
MWLVFQVRVQSGEAFKRMKWRRDARCVVTGRPRVGEGPKQFRRPFRGLVATRRQRLQSEFFVFAIVLWSIWATRNKMGVIRWQQGGLFPKSRVDALFKINVCLQKWRARFGGHDQESLDV